MSSIYPERPGRHQRESAQPSAEASNPDDAYQDDGHQDSAYQQNAHPDGARQEESAHPIFARAELPTRRVRGASKRVRRRRRSLIFLVVIAFVVAVSYFAFQAVQPMLTANTAKDYPGPGHGSVTFIVPAGATGRTVAAGLVQDGVVQSESAFLDALQAVSGGALIQPGTFGLKLEMKASDAVSVLLAPDNNKVHYAAIDQNLREPEVLALLAKSTGIAESEFTTLAKTPATFGLPAAARSLEGYLKPGEYRFPLEMTAQQILAQLVQATKDTLVKDGVTDPKDQYRVLTIASIIEFEGNEANYAMISGAIENRLNNPNAETGGRLESDATVAYGLGLKTYNITDAQKNDASNPYNTFANPGLPVGPIGSPKAKAIDAAAHPQVNPYYFWVTVNLTTGETLYATTYAEHLTNVAKYQAWCDANAGKCK
ncbi:endolytic transglycosylase MltG [Paenarthrobacter sp. PH39-S1]|uniref:endolytic transglycosylase MltG n=1 Tax=Paenarthrobacter sp. PH39-S1 TaxID=3046204 RepID=UPI0024BA2CD4|nr:endolytic transglycosylase MltG [Paenarthrobacter sp. PH39-S1]MDJ0355515.1 endolytic transglycosylase MltG [Paenarthrobacter sp. PH39-S1]